MRIKSYFAPSVQSAIALARKEFGEDVTLITSHVAPPENRDLGEYEVVFAIEELGDAESEPAPEPETEPVASASGEFRELLEQAVAAPASPQLNLPEKLEQLRALFVEIGIEPSMIRALMTMVGRCVPSSEPLKAGTDAPPGNVIEPRAQAPVVEPPAQTEQQEQAEPHHVNAPTLAPEPPKPPSAAQAKYSAAELAFLSSVSKPAKNAAAPSPDWKFGS